MTRGIILVDLPPGFEDWLSPSQYWGVYQDVRKVCELFACSVRQMEPGYSHQASCNKCLPRLPTASILFSLQAEQTCESKMN